MSQSNDHTGGNRKVHLIYIKAYNTTELCDIYKISAKTFNKMTRPHKEAIGIRAGRYFYPKQVETIIKILGIPRWMKLEDPER